MIGNEKWPLKGAISWDCFGSIVHWKTIGILKATKICQLFGCHSMYDVLNIISSFQARVSTTVKKTERM